MIDITAFVWIGLVLTLYYIDKKKSPAATGEIKKINGSYIISKGGKLINEY